MTSDTEQLLPLIERVEVFNLLPNDTLVFTLPSDTTLEQVHHFRDALDERFPNVLVITSGVQLSVIREGESP